MLLQFNTARKFIVPVKDVISVVKGNKKPVNNTFTIGNRDVLDLVKEKAISFLTRYPRECETWGADAMKKQPVTKGRNARSPQAPKADDQDIA